MRTNLYFCLYPMSLMNRVCLHLMNTLPCLHDTRESSWFWESLGFVWRNTSYLAHYVIFCTCLLLAFSFSISVLFAWRFSKERSDYHLSGSTIPAILEALLFLFSIPYTLVVCCMYMQLVVLNYTQRLPHFCLFSGHFTFERAEI
jgi:hypothetical protein